MDRREVGYLDYKQLCFETISNIQDYPLELKIYKKINVKDFLHTLF